MKKQWQSNDISSNRARNHQVMTNAAFTGPVGWLQRVARRHRWLLPVFLASVSFGLVLAALISEFASGQAPCRLCYIQRFPHVVTGICAVAAWQFRNEEVFHVLFIAVCAVTCLFGTVLSILHTGGELGYWDISASCQMTIIQDGLVTPNVFFTNQAATACERSAWRLWGLPMAGFNIIASFGLALLSLSWIAVMGVQLDLSAA